MAYFRTGKLMTDIVERLRRHVSSRVCHPDYRLQNGAWSMMEEAADEIERLRGIVKEVTPDYERQEKALQEAVEEERERCAEIVEAYCALLNISQGLGLAKEIRKDPDYIDTDFVATTIQSLTRQSIARAIRGEE